MFFLKSRLLSVNRIAPTTLVYTTNGKHVLRVRSDKNTLHQLHRQRVPRVRSGWCHAPAGGAGPGHSVSAELQRELTGAFIRLTGKGRAAVTDSATKQTGTPFNLEPRLWQQEQILFCSLEKVVWSKCKKVRAQFMVEAQQSFRGSRMYHEDGANSHRPRYGCK